MALNNSKQFIIEQRREIVSRLRIRGFTQREIVSSLAAKGMVNPKTGKPYSVGIINADLQTMQNQWRESAQADTGEHKARQLAEIQALKRQGWAREEPKIILQALELEIAITGTKAPIKQMIGGIAGSPIEHKEFVVMLPAEASCVDEWTTDNMASSIRPAD